MSKGLAVFVLWGLACLGSMIGGVAAPFYYLLYPFFKNGSHVRNVAEAQDRVLAAMYFGGTGRHTVSLEAAFYDRKSKQRLRAVKLALDRADKEHCTQAAINAQAYCRLKDHEPGDK
jgi:hypothetical protein